MASTSFIDLLQIHMRLDELFLEHQCALLRLDVEGATAALEAYEVELLLHMLDEEELMIPLYRERADAPVGGAAEIFLGEHNKLRQYLVLLKEELSKLTSGKPRERDVIWFLDSEHLFKRLLVHHDSRERKMLYPLLDQITTVQEKEALFASLKLGP